MSRGEYLSEYKAWSKNTKVVIMRGPSGSGKSTFIMRNLPSAQWLSADFFFRGTCPESGFPTYEFDPARIGEAHAWCFRQYMKALHDNCYDEIVVDNTNSRLWEMENYIYLAKQFNRTVDIITMHPLQISVEELTRRNIHGVSQEIIQKMVDTYEPHPDELSVSSQIADLIKLEIKTYENT